MSDVLCVKYASDGAVILGRGISPLTLLAGEKGELTNERSRDSEPLIGDEACVGESQCLSHSGVVCEVFRQCTF